MKRVAKIFKSGNSQAVRLPKDFRTAETEFHIQRMGTAILLTPMSDPWRFFDEALDQFSSDFMEEGRKQPQMQVRNEF